MREIRNSHSATAPIVLAIAASLLTSCVTTRPVLPESYPAYAAHRIEIDGVSIHYFDFNPYSDGVPVLYIHGYSGCALEAHYLQDDIVPTRRIVALDLPGSGLSDKPEIAYTADYFVEMVRLFVDAMGLRRFDLIGHSMGGEIAVVFAVRYPELIRRLVLIAPYGLDGEAGPLFTFLSNTGIMVDLSLNLHSATLLTVAMKHNIFFDATKVPQGLLDYLAVATFKTDNGVGALASMTRHTIGQDPVDDLLPSITTPTRIIWGENDALLPFRYAELFNEGIPDSDLVAISECGHMPQIEQQEATAASIVEFLDR